MCLTATSRDARSTNSRFRLSFYHRIISSNFCAIHVVLNHFLILRSANFLLCLCGLLKTCQRFTDLFVACRKFFRSGITSIISPLFPKVMVFLAFSAFRHLSTCLFRMNVPPKTITTFCQVVASPEGS